MNSSAVVVVVVDVSTVVVVVVVVVETPCITASVKEPMARLILDAASTSAVMAATTEPSL